MNRTILTASTLLILFAGDHQAQAQSQLEKSRAGSQNIYKAKVEEPKDFQKHDRVLIVVSERALANVDQDMQSDRKTEYTLAIDEWLRVTGGKSLSPEPGPYPEIEAEAELKTKGKGKVKRNDRLEMRVQATVIEVLDNGDLKLEATRERTVGGEVTTVTLFGIAPARWVGKDDSIPSDRLADLKISYTGKGVVSARTGSTWLGTIVDWLWPF